MVPVDVADLRQVHDFVFKAQDLGSEISSLDKNTGMDSSCIVLRNTNSTIDPPHRAVSFQRPIDSLGESVKVQETSMEQFEYNSAHVKPNHGQVKQPSQVWDCAGSQQRVAELMSSPSQNKQGDWSPGSSFLASASPSSAAIITSRRQSPAQSKSRKIDPPVGFVKRPLNSFMLYRKDRQHEVPTNNHQSISRIIGDMWRKETAETKNYYDSLAKEERERHQLEHPGYKFQPKKKKKDGKLMKATTKNSEKLRHMELQKPFEDQETQPNLTRSGSPSICQAHRVPKVYGPGIPVANQNSSWAPISYAPSMDPYAYPSNFSEIRQAVPPHYGHYAGHVECLPVDSQFQDSQLQDVRSQTINYDLTRRDPQDWHQAQFSRSQTPSHEPTLDMLQVYNPYEGSYTSQRMPPIFAEWDFPLNNFRTPSFHLGDVQREQGLDSADAYHMDVLQATTPGLGQLPSADFEYSDLSNFAPGIGSWEIEPDRST